jgi:hypothetical protein
MPEQLSHSWISSRSGFYGRPAQSSGDAMATVKLFKMLLDKDLEKNH